jgi:acyl transferase domain-containing protein/acyl carrier protein
MSTERKYEGLEIAIIGMSARFPDSDDNRQYWQNLKTGRESLSFFTDEELRAQGVPESALQDPSFVKTGGGLLHNKDCFDNGFFGYTPEEAALMDPQTRLFHLACWHALEDAGCTSEIEKRKIGLFAGASANTNWKIYIHSKSQSQAVDPMYVNMITSPNFIPTLVSYKLNLRGPAIYIDTACSTSLTAVHVACRSLLTRECGLALAGGICIQTNKQKGYYYREGKVSSKDGHCRTFDAAASGTATGEGTGVVVLKRLQEAIREGDHIYAVIRSSFVNNDGSFKAGYTTPSVKGQVDCIVSAQKLAHVSPESITYIEAHGTATKLGDPIEVRALNEAFGTGGNKKFCAVGSVKTNIGHLDTAAGVAGLIKTALSLKHGEIPASLNYASPNPEIDFAAGPFYVNTRLQPWPRKDNQPLRAGVSSFGIGGTNAHAILEEAPEREAGDAGRSSLLLTVSAKTEQSVTRYLQSLKLFLEQEPQTNLADMCYTLQTGRRAFAYRQSVAFRNTEELMQVLESGKYAAPIQRIPEKTPSIVFMFPGQGSQYAGMCKDLYCHEPVFRKQLDEGFAILKELTNESFIEVWLHGDEATINNTRYAQPLVFLMEYSLAEWLGSVGIHPQYMIGHSIGEYVAACISGVFTFKEALRVVVKRGELMSRVAPGAMLSVPVSADGARTYINEKISLAAVNGPGQVVLSGDPIAVAVLMQQLSSQGIPFVTLHTSHAFHSAMQDPVKEAFQKELQQITFNTPGKPFISNVTGEWIDASQACSPGYWVRHMRQTVQFSSGLQTILSKKEHLLFIEVGAGHSLSSLLRQQTVSATTLNLIRSIKEKENDVCYLTNCMGKLWASGVTINWESYYTGQRRRKISVPVYSFEPVRFPTEVDPFEGNWLAEWGRKSNPANRELKDWLYYPTWKQVVGAAVTPTPNKQVYLIFSNDRFFSATLTAALCAENNHRIINVCRAEEYERIGVNEYALDAANPIHYDHLLNDLLQEGLLITDIVYAWGMEADAQMITLQATNTNLHLVYIGLVHLVQSLLRSNMLKELRLAVLTDLLYNVTGDEDTRYSQSLLMGLVNVLPQEYAVTCFNIDLPGKERIKEYAVQLAAEIRSNNGMENRIVALRHGRKWVPDHEKNTCVVQKSGRVRPGGLYLITGGLGNVGLVLSRYLLQEYGARLVLTGRKKIDLLDAEKSNRYNELKLISSEVHYVAADVSDAMLFEQTVEEIEQQLGRIDGVIHAAGIIDEQYFQLVEDMTVDNVLTMLAPKVQGIENLYQQFGKKRKPDFVWITSSLSTVLGGLGFSAYAAANLYMDHFLLHKAKELPYWRAIGLGGMAFTKADIRKEAGAARNRLTPQEIGALFDWSAGLQSPPVIIQTIEELPVRLHRVYAVKKEVYFNDDIDDYTNNKSERPGLSSTYTPPQNDTEKQLVVLFETFFGITGIGIDDNFFELGGDSLKAMMLLKRIKNDMDTSITLTDLLTHTTIRLMAAKIIEHGWLNSNAVMNNEIVI